MSTQPGSDDRTQDELLHDLQYGSPDEQIKALGRLTAVGEAEALDAVIDYLQEPAPETAGHGLKALRVLANKYIPVDRYGLAEALIPFLSSQEWQHRLNAVRLLNTYPNELAVEPIRDLLYESRLIVYKERDRQSSPSRILAERTLSEGIMALANGGRLFALQDVLEMLGDPALRIVATRALGVIGSETERQRLEDLVEDRDPRVRDAAQWALGLMDERAEQFLNPPTEIPEPPPGRLHPIYWSHRQLTADDNSLLQFLVVRMGIEHLVLDQFISEGRVPELCTIVVRCYDGETLPDHRHNEAEIVGIWEYNWHGPRIRKRALTTSSGERGRKAAPRGRGALLTASYPRCLPDEQSGLVSFDCQFQPFMGQGWIYHVYTRDGEWTFARQRQTWTT